MYMYQPGLAVFSEWLNDIADVQDELLLTSKPNADREKSNYKEKPMALILQHQQKTQQRNTIQNLSKILCRKMANIQYGNLRSSKK